jgi:cytochrome c
MPGRRAAYIAPIAILIAIFGMPAYAADSSGEEIARGHALVIARCSRCHAVERTGDSPYKPAPPFRTLHERYEVENLAEAFAEGITVPHKGVQQMPQFRLEPAEIDDLLAYLKSLEPPAAPTGRRQ